jgi:Carboxypeptidase regulatory-like domain
MEKPGLVKTKWGIKLRFVILSLLFIVTVIFTLLQCNNKKNMAVRKSVKGIIQNKAGEPVTDAIVMIIDGSEEFNDIASVSGDDGEFFLSNIVVPGRYVLQIQHKGNAITKEINVQLADTVLHINF